LAYPVSQIVIMAVRTPLGGVTEPYATQPWTLISRPQVTQVGVNRIRRETASTFAGESGQARNGAAQPGTSGALGYRD